MRPREAYETLGLSPPVTDEDIEAAYRRLTKEHHPDQGGSRERWIRIKEARDTLIAADRSQQRPGRQTDEDGPGDTSDDERAGRTSQRESDRTVDDTATSETTRGYSRQRRTRQTAGGGTTTAERDSHDPRQSDGSEDDSDGSQPDGSDSDNHDQQGSDEEYGRVTTALGWLLAVPLLVVQAVLAGARFVGRGVPWWAEFLAVFGFLFVTNELLMLSGRLFTLVSYTVLLFLPTGTAIFFGLATVVLLIGGELTLAVASAVITAIASGISVAC